MAALAKQRKIRGGHRAHAKKVIGEIEALIGDITNENRYELAQLKDSLAKKVEVIKALDDSILKLMEDSEDIDEAEFGEALSDASDHELRFCKVVHIVEQELNKGTSNDVVNLTETVNQAASGSADANVGDSTVVEPSSNESEEVIVEAPTVPAMPSANMSARVKLPKLEVQKFKGSVFKWQEFWDGFESSIHSNTGLSDVDKFSYLKGLVEEPARSAISGFALTAANYRSAIDLLKRRFGRPATIQRAHINELLNVQGVFREREIGRLRALYDKIECHHRGLVALSVDEATYSSIVVPALLERLPENVRLAMTRGEDFKNWTMEQLLERFLVELELREEAAVVLPNDGRQAGHGKRDKREFTNSALFAGWGKGVCAFCRGNHNHEACQKVKDTNERKNIVRKYSRCFNCLDKGHLARNCMTKVVCHKCKGKHHTALCEGKGPKEKGKEGDGSQHEDPIDSLNGFIGTGCRIALQTAQAMVKGDRQQRVRVLFDSGSHKSYVTAKTADRAGLTVVRKELLGLSTFGQKVKETEVREVVRFDVIPLRCGKVLSLEAYVVPVISRIRNEHIEVVKHNFPHLKKLWFSDVNKTADELEVDLLIGSDHLWNFQNGRIIRGEPDEPVALETELGFVLSGPLKGKCTGENDDTASTLVSFVGTDRGESISRDVRDGKLDDAVHRLWDLDSLGIKQSDEVCEAFQDNISFDGERYSVKLPWKVGHDTLPTNYELSLSRMRSQVRRLRQKPDILREYDSIIKEQLKTGVIERVPELDAAEKVHYLPHQAVVRQNAQTTNIRIVYDASAKDRKSNTSLNDCLHVGHSLNPLLTNILLRFRVNKVALVADIEKAFLNVAVDRGDRDCLRFLWPDDPSDSKSELSVYRFCREVFGLNASPFLLNGSIRYHLHTRKRTRCLLRK